MSWFDLKGLAMMPDYKEHGWYEKLSEDEVKLLETLRESQQS